MSPSYGELARPGASASSHGTERKVCVVDDDVSLRRALRRLITGAGFSVDTFESAEAFLSAQRDVDTACLVLDVNLGGLSGFELYERLAASGRSIPVIFITAYDSPSYQERAVAAGAVAYFKKPFDDEPLIEAIHRAM